MASKANKKPTLIAAPPLQQPVVQKPTAHSKTATPTNVSARKTSTTPSMSSMDKDMKEIVLRTERSFTREASNINYNVI
jgi:hypothetical protein